MGPVFLLPDSGPLFSLAAGGLLGILERFPVVLTDVVKEETVDKGRLPNCSVEAARLSNFYDRHAADIVVAQTQVGTALSATRAADPDHRPARNLGELSIQSHLIDLHARNSPARPVVLFEDNWFYDQRGALPRNCRLVSTETFLRLAQDLKIIRSATKARAAIAKGRPDASLLLFDSGLG